PQVGDAHLLQRAGGDLPRVDGRARAGAGAAPAARAPHGPSVRTALLAHHADLHRGRALLRRAGVAVLSERAAAALTPNSPRGESPEVTSQVTPSGQSWRYPKPVSCARETGTADVDRTGRVAGSGKRHSR